MMEETHDEVFLRSEFESWPEISGRWHALCYGGWITSWGLLSTWGLLQMEWKAEDAICEPGCTAWDCTNKPGCSVSICQPLLI